MTALAAGIEGWAWLTRREPLLTRETVRSARTGGKRLDWSKAVRELGMPKTPLEEAVRRALGWFRTHGYLRG